MARDINASTLAQFISNELQVYFAVELTLPNVFNPAQDVIDRMWTGYSDKSITVNGASQTFTGMGELLGISGTSETSDLAANGLQIQILADSTTIPALRDLDYQGKPLTVYLGALDPNTRNALEPIVYFEGFNDKLTFVQDGDSLLVTISAEHKFIRLSQASNRRYSDADQKLDAPTDKSFQYVNATSKAFYTWGV